MTTHEEVELKSNGAPAIWIKPLVAGEDATAFRTLNEEWITRYFTLEPRDRETLGDPEGQILARGGHIFLVWAQGEDAAEAVGCVALIPMGSDVFELSKMAVSPRLRGQGIGRRLIEYAIARAKELGARSLVLGSSTKLANALHLYESVGFQHVPAERIPKMGYSRADAFMEMPL